MISGYPVTVVSGTRILSALINGLSLVTLEARCLAYGAVMWHVCPRISLRTSAILLRIACRQTGELSEDLWI